MARARAKQASTATDHLILWRPEVHKRFGESLYYFLISFRDFSQSTFQDLKKLLDEEMDLRGYCLYGVFGFYDSLLRIWLNPKAYENLRAALLAQPYVDVVIDFAVTDQSHWALRKKPISREELARVIAKHEIKDFEAAQERDSRALKKMSKDNLLVKERPSSGDKVKFYISISQPAPTGGSAVGEVTHRINECISKLAKSGTRRDPLHDASVYFGRGFASLLVKGVAGSLTVLMDFAQDVRIALAPYSSNTATFIIGRLSGSETDDIQPGSLRQEYVFDPDVYAWIPELYAPGKPEVSSERIRLAEDYLRKRGLFHDLDFESRLWLGRLVVALIRQTVSHTTGAPLASDMLSSWLRESESWLRDRLDRYLDAVSADIGRKAGRIARDARIPRNAKFAPLGDLIDAVGSLADTRRQARGAGAGLLSARDRGISIRVVSLRNRVQHNDTQYLTDWHDTIDTIAEFMPIFAKLRDEVSDVIDRWEQTLHPKGAGRRSGKSRKGQNVDRSHPTLSHQR